MSLYSKINQTVDLMIDNQGNLYTLIPGVVVLWDLQHELLNEVKNMDYWYDQCSCLRSPSPILYNNVEHDIKNFIILI